MVKVMENHMEENLRNIDGLVDVSFLNFVLNFLSFFVSVCFFL